MDKLSTWFQNLKALSDEDTDFYLISQTNFQFKIKETCVSC